MVSGVFSRYVLKETLRSFVLAVAAFTIMLFVGNSLRFLAERLPLVKFLKAMPYLFVYLCSFTMPMGLLTAAVFTFGRLRMDNELIAIRASGLPIRVVTIPVMLLALGASIIALPLNCYIAPECHYRLEQLLLPDPSAPEFQFTDRGEPTLTMPFTEGPDRSGVVDVYIGESDGDVCTDVFICKTIDGKPAEFILAEEATLSAPSKYLAELVFQLRNGLIYYVEENVADTGPPATFDTNMITIGLPSATEIPRGFKEMTVSQLMHRLRRGDLAAHNQPKALTEVHKRISLAFSSLALVLIGIPLGIITRRGNFLAAFGASVGIIFVMYYPLLLIGEVLGNMGKVNPAIAMWTANAATMAIGVTLLLRTETNV